MSVLAVSCVAASLGISAFFSSAWRRLRSTSWSAFARAHGSSVILNGVTMLAAVAALALEAFRRKGVRTARRPR